MDLGHRSAVFIKKTQGNKDQESKAKSLLQAFLILILLRLFNFQEQTILGIFGLYLFLCLVSSYIFGIFFPLALLTLLDECLVGCEIVGYMIFLWFVEFIIVFTYLLLLSVKLQFVSLKTMLYSRCFSPSAVSWCSVALLQHCSCALPLCGS